MAKINLLPWREALREQRRKQYLSALALVAVGGVLVVVGVGQYYSARIESQQARNAYLNTEITELNRKITEISGLKRRRDELVERMEVIQSLQGNRPVIVRVFDELVQTLPDGVYYTHVEKRGQALRIRGTAKSNNRVSALMRRLDGSDWFAEPNLLGVTSNPSFGEQANDFNLVVQQTTPDAGESD